jgi:parallel beta-helix repeat protein
MVEDMNKIVSVMFCFLIVSSTFLFPISSAKSQQLNTIYVDDDNTDGPWDGSMEHPFQYIQDGINAASQNDIVFVSNGLYSQGVKINKTITLRGEDREHTVIGREKLSDINLETKVSVTADHVILTNFTIQYCQGINSYSEYNTITNNLIKCNKIGVFLVSSSNNSIENNTIKNNNIGIGSYVAYMSQQGSENNLIENNMISFNRLGIWVWYGSHLIRNNTITFNVKGVKLDGENEICYNSFKHNGRNAVTHSIQNEWYNNYWNRPRILPYPILGKVGIISTFFYWFYLFPWIQFDWHPAQEPYDIDGGGMNR